MMMKGWSIFWLIFQLLQVFSQSGGGAVAGKSLNSSRHHQWTPLDEQTSIRPSTGYHDPITDFKMAANQEEEEQDLDTILKGVKTYVKSLTFGFVQLTSPSAFSILVGKLDANVNAPIVAGSRFGQGRLIVGTHTAYMQPSSPDTAGGDNDQLLENQIEWLAAASAKPTKSIGLFQASSSLADFLGKKSFKVVTLSKNDLTSSDDTLFTTYSVICISSTYSIFKEDKITQILQKFVQNGGGLFLVNTPWSWDVDEMKFGNKLIAPAGLVWHVGGAYADKTTQIANTYNASRALLQNTHAGQLWTGINAFLRGGQVPFPTENMTGFMKLVDGAIESYPDDETGADFLKTVKSDMQSLDLTGFIPSATNPAKKPIDRVNLLIHYTMTSNLLEADEIKAHPAADIFPGKILDGAAANSSGDAPVQKHVIHFNFTDQQKEAKINGPGAHQNWWDIQTQFGPGRVPTAREIEDLIKDNVQVDPKIKDWHSTGLYAPAGQVITVKFEGDGSGGSLNGFKVLIGSHSDDLRKLDSWSRCPRVTFRKPVVQGSDLRIASPFGGLIYIVVPSNYAGQSSLSVTIDGAVKAPYFILGKTTVQEWLDTIKNFNGPWAEFESSKIILTVPTTDARQVSDPEGLMTFWDQVMDTFAEFTDISQVRPKPYRMVADVQISAGYMHSGYPIMIPVPEAKSIVNVSSLKSSNGWGPYHEVGHNHQESVWTWKGLTEVTNNLMVLYIYDHLLKINYDTVRPTLYPTNQAKEAQNYVKNGKSFTTWQGDAWLALGSYIQLQKRFGWDLFKKVFVQYHKLTSAEKNLNDDGLRDLWVIMVSQQAKENLVPFYRSWGIPISEAVDIKLKDLPMTTLSIDDLFK